MLLAPVLNVDVLLLCPSLAAAFAVITACCIAAHVLRHYLRTEQLKTPPSTVFPILNLVDKDFAAAQDLYLKDLPGLLREGYRRYKHTFYQLWSVDSYITIASADFLEEMNGLPEGTLDFHAATQKLCSTADSFLLQRMIGDYTWLQVADDLLAHTIITDLTRQIGIDSSHRTGKLLPILREEIEYAVQHGFPPCKDWTPVHVHQISLDLIASTMGRVFVGPALNRNKEWLQTAIQFVDDVFAGGWKLKSYSLFMRPFAARFLVPEIRRVRKHQATARKLLVPIIQRRRSSAESLSKQQSGYQKTNDLIQWLMDNGAEQSPPRSSDNIAELALVAYLGSTHTTATTMSQLLLDLAARPEYIEALREEIKAMPQAKDSEGWSNIKHSFHINHTSKLDSIMKESQRLNPAFLMSYSRIVAKPFKFSNGLEIPAGSHIQVPASQISLDPDIFPYPESFKGFRFADLRAEHAENKHRYQFTTTSPRTMHFGFGRQACPGRFLASDTIKAVVVYLLSEFDMRLPDGVWRPESGVVGAQVSPPKNADILFRRRRR